MTITVTALKRAAEECIEPLNEARLSAKDGMTYDQARSGSVAVALVVNNPLLLTLLAERLSVRPEARQDPL
jgi:hypothetical protein